MTARLLASLAVLAASRALAQGAPPPPLPALPPEPELKAPSLQPSQPARSIPESAQPHEEAFAGFLQTSTGALGGLALPTLAAPLPGRLGLTAVVDWRRGGGFLFPGSTSQRTGWALAASFGVTSLVEAYGALWFHSTNLFAPAARHTLGSYGDADLGVKLLLPRRGPVSGGALLELDVPSGVGGFSLQGVGGRAALLLGWAARVGPLPLSATALAGYRIDNSGRLQSGQLTTFEAYALALSRYDRVFGGLALSAPLRWATPGVDLELAAPVARQTALPASGSALLAQLTVGLQAQTPLPGLSWEGGVRFSLSRRGQLAGDSLPLAGFAPDAPWQIFTALAYSFEPRMPQLPRWSRDKQADFGRPLPEPAARSVKATQARARVVVVATDARTRLPISGAWISWAEGSDPGAITGTDGTARLEHDAGAATIAVAHEKYELATEPLVLVAGEEKQAVVLLTPNAADATVRGRLAGEDGVPVRAALQLIAATAKGGEPRWFEGSYSLTIPHGQYVLSATTPGFRVDAVRLEVRPGETITQDLMARRIAGEPGVRATPKGIELSRPVPFVSGKSALFPVAFPVLTELAQALKADGRAFVLEVRVKAEDLPAGAGGETRAAALSAERARGVTDYLQDKGVKKEQLTPRGGGLARPGQLLLELVPAADEKPRAGRATETNATETAALGAHP